MVPRKPITRRKFIRTGSIAATAVATAPSIQLGAAPATKTNPVRVALIGVGTRGRGLLSVLASDPIAKLVAICDVYKPHLELGIRTANNPDLKTYSSYRKMLENTKIEAVIIATPDHWHEKMLLDCIAADKDVFCEKGWTTSIASAKRMRKAVKDAGAVMQLGHQGRQHVAAEVGAKRIFEGAIGDVTLIKTGRFFNGLNWRKWGPLWKNSRPDPAQVIKDLDWEAWLGDCPKIDFNDRHFWHWRCYWPYGTGQCGDLLSHELDHVQSVLKYGIPDTCVSIGQINYWKDDREVPDTWHSTYTFEDKNCMVTYEGCFNSRRGQFPEYIGRKGRLIYNSIGQNASMFEIYTDHQAHQLAARKQPQPTEFFYPGKEHRRQNHMQDFLHCVRSREKPSCNENEAFIETATLVMALEAYKQKRLVRWDRESEEII